MTTINQEQHAIEQIKKITQFAKNIINDRDNIILEQEAKLTLKDHQIEYLENNYNLILDELSMYKHNEINADHDIEKIVNELTDHVSQLTIRKEQERKKLQDSYQSIFSNWKYKWDNIKSCKLNLS